MDWTSVVLALITSGVVVGIIEWMRFKHKDSADAKLTEADADTRSTDNALKYAETLERRLEKVEEGQEKLNIKLNIFQRAINCAYRCDRVDKPEQDCPVLQHLNDKDQ